MEAGEVLAEPATSKKTSKKQSKSTSTPSRLKVPPTADASKVMRTVSSGDSPSLCVLYRAALGPIITQLYEWPITQDFYHPVKSLILCRSIYPCTCAPGTSCIVSTMTSSSTGSRQALTLQPLFWSLGVLLRWADRGRRRRG